MTSIIEECRVSPELSTAVAELSLPLTYFDIIWQYFYVIQRLLLYKIPVSTSSFNEEIIPKLKTSLSLALNHYLPLAGNLVYPLEDSDNPFLRYVAGDSVSLTFVESTEDFDTLVGNEARKCDDFYQLVPKSPSPSVSTSSKTIPLFAVQVTLFPNSGISIGFTNNHVIGDANMIVRFLKAWASISKLDGVDSHLLGSDLLPFYDRSVIKDPYNFKTKVANHLRSKYTSSLFSKPTAIPTNKVRATFVLSQFDIQKMKNYVSKSRPELSHVSSYTVTCGYIWTCWLKSEHAVGETPPASEKEVEYFLIAVDCRSRLDPPIPAAYFGNCLAAIFATSSHEELVSNDGFLVASEAIGATIKKAVNDKNELLSEYSKFSMDAVNMRRCLSVSGSPKYTTNDVDFGWGRPEKFESINIDRGKSMSLNKSASEENGLEISLSMEENKMKAFASIFTTGLHNI